MRTKITELLGIQYPIIQGGMQWVGTPSWPPPSRTPAAWHPHGADAADARALRARSSAAGHDRQAFGVNLTILPAITPPPYAEYLNAIIESGVKIVETAGNNPKDFVARSRSTAS